jgi:hypothetical protein
VEAAGREATAAAKAAIERELEDGLLLELDIRQFFANKKGGGVSFHPSRLYAHHYVYKSDDGKEVDVAEGDIFDFDVLPKTLSFMLLGKALAVFQPCRRRDGKFICPTQGYKNRVLESVRKLGLEKQKQEWMLVQSLRNKSIRPLVAEEKEVAILKNQSQYIFLFDETKVNSDHVRDMAHVLTLGRTERCWRCNDCFSPFSISVPPRARITLQRQEVQAQGEQQLRRSSRLLRKRKHMEVSNYDGSEEEASEGSEERNKDEDDAQQKLAWKVECRAAALPRSVRPRLNADSQ